MSFMTDEIVTDILRRENGGTNFEVIDGKLENGIVKPGNNYCCEASRYVVSYQKNGKKETKSIFLKIPYNVRSYNSFREKGLYKKELYMYRTVLQRYLSLLPNDRIAPMYYSSDEKDAIILEDISESGYRMCDRYHQLDFEHCAVAFKTLAKFHALSVKLHQTNPDIVDEVRKELIFDSSFSTNEKYQTFYQSRFSKVTRHTHPEYVKAHADTFEFFKNNLVHSAIDLLRPKRNSFNVLNHGDFWTNNTMFKYDPYGRVLNAKLVDFQLCRWSSPAIDICYFTINSMKFEVFEKYFDLLLHLYVETLNAVMSYLECDQILTTDDLRKDVESKYNYIIFVLVGITPTALANPDDELSGTYDEKLLDAKRYVELSTKWFSYFIEKGVFSKYHDTVNAINTFLTRFQGEIDVTVTKYNLEENIIESGKNFCSVISRLRIEYEKDELKQRKSVLLKITFLSPNYELLQKTGIHDREMYVYEILLPKMYELWNGSVFTPTVYAETESKVLVMEDLIDSGYAIKKRQLDLEHCKTAIRTLAQYHALSAKFLQARSDWYRDISLKDVGSESALAKTFFKLYDRFVETISPLVTESVQDKLKVYREPYKNNTELYFSPRVDGLNIIVHGDFWLNNILFKYGNKGSVCGAKFVDWQLCRKISPVLDLINFFVSSVQFDVYEKYHNSLFNFYLDVFNGTSSSLKGECRYTRNQLDGDIQKYKLVYVMTIVHLLPSVMNDESYFAEIGAEIEEVSYWSVAAKWLLYLDAEKLL